MDPQTLDYGDFGQQPQAPAIEDTWNQARSLQFQKLQAADSEVDQQWAEGVLAPEDYHDLKGQVQQQLQPLAQMQKQAQAQAKEQAFGQAQELAAHQEALGQQNAAFRARGFQSSTTTYHDPVSGQTKHFYQSEPGKWAEMEMGDSSGSDESPASSDAPLSGAGSLQELGAEGVVGAPQAVPNGDGTHTMEIYNGANRELLTFQGKQLVNHVAFDRQGNPTQPGGQGGDLGMVPEHVANEARARALRSSGPEPRFYGDPRNMRQVADFQHAHRNWENHVASMQRDIMTDWAKNRLQQQGQGFSAEHQLKQQQFQADQKEKDQKAKADHQKAAHDDFDKAAQHYYDKFVAQRAEIDKHNNQPQHKDAPAAKEIPLEDYQKTHESMQEKAHEMALRDFVRRGKPIPEGMREEADALRAQMKGGKAGAGGGATRNVDPDALKTLADTIAKATGAPAAPLTEDQLNAPSAVGAEDVERLHGQAQQEFHGHPQTFADLGKVLTGQVDLSQANDRTRVGMLRDLLAHSRGRAMTVGERAQYERLHAFMKDESLKNRFRLPTVGSSAYPGEK